MRMFLFCGSPREKAGCSVDDVVRVLKAAAPYLPALPDIIAFRQPTRKQQAQHSVWGRFLYFAEIGECEGRAVVLEAQELGHELKWPRRMTLEDRAEFERLKDDGHVFREEKRCFVAELEEAAVRQTMLYWTLLHELGHYADFCEKVLDDATALDPDLDLAEELYFSRPSAERESYAHGFAEKLRAILQADGVEG